MFLRKLRKPDATTFVWLSQSDQIGRFIGLWATDALDKGYLKELIISVNTVSTIKIKFYLSVSPEINRQMCIKVAQK